VLLGFEPCGCVRPDAQATADKPTIPANVVAKRYFVVRTNQSDIAEASLRAPTGESVSAPILDAGDP
jgi:hypothetical protein